MEPAASEQGSPALGAVLDGRYRLEARIARGGTSTVYRAVHVGTERAVAVKILDAALMADAVAVERFRAEARVASRVPHPNVIDVFDVGRDAERRPYMVTELLVGESLASYLKRAPGPLPVQEVAALLLPLLDALAAAHDEGIVHRDFKPENVFLCDAGHASVVPKLLDFGISKELGRNDAAHTRARTTPGVAIGTPHYISPEQARGDREPTPAADVWSAGVVLYRLLAGRVPFDGADVHEVLSHVLLATPATPAGFGAPAAVSALVMRCLAKDPDGRPADARAFKTALCAALGLPPNAGAPARVSLPSIQPPPMPEAAITVPPPAPLPRAQSGAHLRTPGAVRSALDVHGPPRVLRIPAAGGAGAEIVREPPRTPPPARRARRGALAVAVAVGIFGAGMAVGFYVARQSAARAPVTAAP